MKAAVMVFQMVVIIKGLILASGSEKSSKSVQPLQVVIVPGRNRRRRIIKTDNMLKLKMISGSGQPGGQVQRLQKLRLRRYSDPIPGGTQGSRLAED